MGEDLGRAGHSERPLIAIPARFSSSAAALRYEAEVTARKLLEAVYEAGGEPLVVHPSAPGEQISPDEMAQRVRWADGVLLPGGGDLSGRWSNQGHHPTLYDVDEQQDAFDLALARHALDTGLPLLSICRGTQVVNVARGGTLVQDMDSDEAYLRHHRNHVHHVSVDPGTLTDDIVGAKVEVSCYHHQCIAEVGEDLVVSARSEEGVIEALEFPDSPGFYLGVQWHPEDNFAHETQQRAIFEALVEAARAARG